MTVLPKEFRGRKLESTTKDGSDLGDEDEENKLEELKVITVVEGDADYISQNPRHVCLTEGVCLVPRVNTGSAVQHCSR